MRHKGTVGITVFLLLVLAGVALVVRRSKVPLDEQSQRHTSSSRTAEEQRRFEAELAAIKAEAAALDARKRAEDEALSAALGPKSAEEWEREQRAKDAEIEARQHAETAAAIKTHNELMVVKKAKEQQEFEQRRAEWLRDAALLQAEAERQKAARLREREVAAQEEAARAARESAAAAARAARAAEERARAAQQPVHCTTTYDARGNAHTTCQ